MNNIQKFFTSKQVMVRGSLFVALFATISLGSVFLTGSNLPLASVAHALGSSCSIATAMGDYVSSSTPQVGDTLTYTLEAAPALTASTTINVTDVLPAGLTFVSATASMGTYSSSTNTWSVVGLNGASSITLAVMAKVNVGTEGQTIVATPGIQYVQSACDQSSAAGTATITVQALATPTTTPQYADLSISKTADVTSTVEGGVVNYALTVLNNSTSTTSTDVVANDVLPSGLTFENATASVGTYASSTGVWTIGDLLPNANATLDIAALTNATGTITNTATVSASTTDPDSSNNSSNVSVFVTPVVSTSTPTSTTPTADLSVVKTVDNANPSEGGTVNYTISVTDLSSSTTSTDVVATDTWPSNLTFVSATSSEGSYASSTGVWTIGDVAPSSTATLDIAATVNSGTAGDTITNSVIANESASTTDPDLSNNSSSVSLSVAPIVCGGGCGATDADIAITKTADVTSTVAGGTINYTIAVIANGPNPSDDVVATDTLPSGLTFENATASIGTYSNLTGVWTIGTLTPSSTATLTIQALVNASTTGTVTNTATVSELSTETDLVPGNNSSSVSVLVGGPSSTSTDVDLAIAKTVDNANPAAGATVNFTVVVTDNGPATSTFVLAHDELPSGLDFVSASTSQGSYNMSSGDWNIGTLSPNATATLMMAAMVDTGAAGDTITNTATVTSTLASLVDPNPANNSSSVTLVVQPAACTSGCGGGGGGGGGSAQANLSIVKTVDNNDPATGATIHYTLTVKAGGPSNSTNVVADDVLPAGVTFVSATSSEGSYVNSTGVWTIGTMPAGSTATLTITATVNATAGTTVANTGTVSETAGLINSLSGSDASTATLTVAGGGGTVTPGGGITTGSVLGASTSTGQVLGASCGLYLTSYIHPDRKYLNDPAQVEKLQTFLNMEQGLNLPVDGNYSAADIAAVNQFQVKYFKEILSPWVALGLPTQFTPTSYVYQTTQRWINLIMCPALNLPTPVLKVDTGV